MGFEQISPYIRAAYDSILSPGWIISERVIFDYELLYVKDGKAEVTIEDRKFTAVPGDIFLFKPKQPHSIVVSKDKPFHQPHIHFDLYQREDSPKVRINFHRLEDLPPEEHSLFREDVISGTPFNLPNLIKLRNPLSFEKMFFDVIKEYEMKIPFYETNIKGLFIQLLVYLMRENYWNNNPLVYSNLEELIRVQNYLNHNNDREVTLDELARFSNISKYYLIRLFKNAFGMSPIQYHQLVRFERAKELIRFTRLPLTEIAERVGFHSIHSFSRAFKNIVGHPPSYYRRKESKLPRDE